MKILKWLNILLILVFIMVVAACGGDDDASDSDDDTQSNPSDVGGQVQSLGDEPVREIAVSPNGESFVVATDSALTQISLVDDDQSSVELDQVRFLAMSSDGGKVAGYSAGNRHVMLWDVEAGTTLGLDGLREAIHVTFSPNDAYLVGVAIGTPVVLVMWSVETGEVAWSIDRGATESDYGGASAAFSPDGQQVAVGLYDGSLSLRDVVTGEVVQRYGGHTTDEDLTNIVSVAFGPDGNTITSVGEDSQVRIWNAETGAARRVIPAWEGTVTYTPNSEWIIAMRLTRANSARTWNVASGQLGQVFDGPVQMMPDGTKVFGGSRGQNVTIFDFASGHALISFEGIDAYDINVPLPDSRSMISTFWQEPIIYQWDVVTGEEMRRWEWTQTDNTD